MNKALLILFTFFLTASCYAQGDDLKKPVSPKDSILLVHFLTDFKTAIRGKNQIALSRLINFSFHCTPCINDSTLKVNDDGDAPKVSEKLFFQSQYKLFFDGRMERSLNRYNDLGTGIFKRFYNIEDNKEYGFFFPYTITPPSSHWEGSQGFIYVSKIKGKYKITSIDMIP